MRPELFSFDTPDWLSFLPDTITVHSYGFLIGIGILAAYYMAVYLGKSLNVNSDQTATLFFWVFMASVVGGKFFFLLESPATYMDDPSKILENFGSGFVFYGSVIFAVPVLIWKLRKFKIGVWEYLDIVAIFAPVLHFFGRLGCFMAGCCHGKVCHNALGVTYTHAASKADPLNTPLYPTQLFSAALLLFIVLLLLYLRKRKSFSGQLFLLYLVIYSVGRSIIEIYRGDEERGFIIGDWLSHSQFIAIAIIAISTIIWIRRKRGSRQ
jgi:phosphatidylglycerol:prolipoprotein diacylglycerol transferase